MAKMMLAFIAAIMPLRSLNLCNIVGVFRGGGDVRYALVCDVGPLYCICLPPRRSADWCSASHSRRLHLHQPRRRMQGVPLPAQAPLRQVGQLRHKRKPVINRPGSWPGHF
ncbi:MAG: hypothetical protein ACLUEK_12760 [Oscillospiraceae bacterium]